MYYNGIKLIGLIHLLWLSLAINFAEPFFLSLKINVFCIYLLIDPVLKLSNVRICAGNCEDRLQMSTV